MVVHQQHEFWRMMRRLPIITHDSMDNEDEDDRSQSEVGGYEINLATTPSASSATSGTPPTSPIEAIERAVLLMDLERVCSSSSPCSSPVFVSSAPIKKSNSNNSLCQALQIPPLSSPPPPPPSAQQEQEREQEQRVSSASDEEEDNRSETSSSNDTPDTPISRYRKETAVFRDDAPTSAASSPPISSVFVRKGSSIVGGTLSLDSQLALEISAARQRVLEQGHGGGGFLSTTSASAASMAPASPARATAVSVSTAPAAVSEEEVVASTVSEVGTVASGEEEEEEERIGVGTGSGGEEEGVEVSSVSTSEDEKMERQRMLLLAYPSDEISTANSQHHHHELPPDHYHRHLHHHHDSRSHHHHPFDFINDDNMNIDTSSSNRRRRRRQRDRENSGKSLVDEEEAEAEDDADDNADDNNTSESNNRKDQQQLLVDGLDFGFLSPIEEVEATIEHHAEQQQQQLNPDWEEKKDSLLDGFPSGLHLHRHQQERELDEETLARSRTPVSNNNNAGALTAEASPSRMNTVSSPSPSSVRALSPTLMAIHNQNNSAALTSLTTRPLGMMTRAATTGQIPNAASLIELEKALSLTESDVGSLDGLPPSLRSRWGNDFGTDSSRTLQRIDGIPIRMATGAGAPRRRATTPNNNECQLRPSKTEEFFQQQQQHQEKAKEEESYGFFSSWPLKLIWGDERDQQEEETDDNNQDQDGSQHQYHGRGVYGIVPGCLRRDDETSRHKSRWRDEDDSFALLACANLIHHPAKPVQTSLVRVTSEPPPLSYAQVYSSSAQQRLHDPRMPAWVEHQFRTRDKSLKDGQYLLGSSRAVIVHEIVRGHWTWATAWSPDGSQLAVATENHHLAILDTTSSTVWRVRHDKKIQGPVKMGTTHSIRSIAWGSQYIAIGGTGNAVSILAAVEPYHVLHTIPNCGFVGSLDWKPDSCDLVIGSRLDRAVVVRVHCPKLADNDNSNNSNNSQKLICDTLHTVERKHWVNGVAFSPSGRYLAIGDAGGSLLVYNYGETTGTNDDAATATTTNKNKNANAGGINPGATTTDKSNTSSSSSVSSTKDSSATNSGLLSLIKSFNLEDAVLAVEWSPEGSWLYAGGEDFTVTVIETMYWEVVHKIKRDRWVQCIAASHSGTHVAVGGVSSEVSLLETKSGWDSVMGMELNGLVPLSAKWHPRDQFLSLTGQNNSIIIIETTNARHVKGHHLHSVGGILAVEFSPDGRMAVVGNDSGVITFFSLSGSTFVTAYELVVTVSNDCLSIKWSLNGLFVVIATRDSLLIVGRKKRDRYGKAVPPKCSGFSVRKVINDLMLDCHYSVSIDFQSQYVALSGAKGTVILDASRDFVVVREWTSGPCFATEWSPLGRWLATIGKDKVLTIYDTSEERVDRWRPVFSVTCDYAGRALAWGPLIVGGLLYLAYAGDGNEITVMEIRTQEGTWETVMRIQRPGAIRSLDWHMDGLLAAAISNGTVSIIDLAYLQSGIAVNEMDYNWQRQALTSFTEIRRNRGTNKMRAVRWIPSAPGSDSLLAVGGTDGELEIVDLTERQRCRGFVGQTR